MVKHQFNLFVTSACKSLQYSDREGAREVVRMTEALFGRAHPQDRNAGSGMDLVDLAGPGPESAGIKGLEATTPFPAKDHGSGNFRAAADQWRRYVAYKKAMAIDTGMLLVGALFLSWKRETIPGALLMATGALKGTADMTHI